jgi:hypothetical protein
MRTFALALGFCLCATTSVSAQKLQDFTGTWKVNPEKVQEKTILVNNPSGAPGIPPPPPQPPDHKYTLEQIRQSGEVLKISGGEIATTAVYTIDPSGKEVSDPLPNSVLVRISTSSWNGGKLVTKWKLVSADGEAVVHGTDVRSITPDGTLLVTQDIESGQHGAHVRFVLEKVQ